MRFRKKSIVIEAIQWHKGDAPLEGMISYGESTIEQFPNYKGFFFIQTMEGNHHVSHGDYVITGVKGEKYPCKPDIFKKTYELVNTGRRTNEIRR